MILRKECLLLSMVDEMDKWMFVQLIHHLFFFLLNTACIFLCQEVLEPGQNPHPDKFYGNFTIDLNDTKIWYRISKALYKKPKKKKTRFLWLEKLPCMETFFFF